MLTVNGLDKWFGSRQVLHHVSFEIDEGRIVGLIGANGAGKTTIMKAILGISQFKGSIELDGQMIDINHHAALVNVGALIEYPGLYPYLTGREQLKLFATGSHRDQEVQSVVDDLRIGGFVDTKTKGYSLGMKQKLGIALAFLNDPELVILDEPMNGLDPQSTAELRALILKKKANGITFLISSHILSELQKVADDVVIINQGQVVTSAPMAAVLAKNERYLLIDTTQNQVAQTLLTDNGYQTSLDASGLAIVRSSIKDFNGLFQLLLNHEIQIKEIGETHGDLEESLLEVLNTPEAAQGGK